MYARIVGHFVKFITQALAPQNRTFCMAHLFRRKQDTERVNHCDCFWFLYFQGVASLVFVQTDRLHFKPDIYAERAQVKTLHG